MNCKYIVHISVMTANSNYQIFSKLSFNESKSFHRVERIFIILLFFPFPYHSCFGFPPVQQCSLIPYTVKNKNMAEGLKILDFLCVCIS